MAVREDAPSPQTAGRNWEMMGRAVIKILTRLYYSIKTNENFVVTGIPRSGTSLLASILCVPNNAFCFNEIYYDPVKLPIFLFRMKYRLRHGRPVPSKIDAAGELVQDTMGQPVVTGQRIFPKKTNDIKLGSNVNIPYLNHIDTLVAYRFRIVALLRNPIFTIGSWNSEKSAAIPEANITEPGMNHRWKAFHFGSSDRIERQAQIWEHYANLIFEQREKISIIRYEDLVDETHQTLHRIARFLKIRQVDPVPSLKNFNQTRRYKHIDRIADVTKRLCPTKSKFGY
jgi:hypothetical protein